MPARSQTAKMGLDVYASDHTRPGFASVQRGANQLITGTSKTAQSGISAVSGAVMGNATFAAAAGGAALVGFAASSVSAFIEVEKKWAEVTTLMPQKTKAATDQMLKDVRSFSKETGFALADSLSATYQTISAGVDPDASTDFLRVAGRAALAGVTDLTTSVDAITSALNAYSASTEEATSYSDAMFTAIRLGKTTFQELAPVMGPVLPLAASMNTEFQEVTAAAAALTAMGNPTSIALTQIRAALVALSKDTKARTMFESVTGMTYQEFQLGGGTIQEALQIIVDEANRTGQSIPQAFGRIEGANAALALSSEKGIATFANAMAGTAGATEEAAAKLEDTTDYTLKRAQAHWNDFKVGTGRILTEIGTGFVQWSGSHLREIKSWFQSEEDALKEYLDNTDRYWRLYGGQHQRRVEAIAANNRALAENAVATARTILVSTAMLTGTPLGREDTIIRTQAGPANLGQWVYSSSAAGGAASGTAAVSDAAFLDFVGSIWRNIGATQDAAFGGGGFGGGGDGEDARRAAEEAAQAALRAEIDRLRREAELKEALDANTDALRNLGRRMVEVRPGATEGILVDSQNSREVALASFLRSR